MLASIGLVVFLRILNVFGNALTGILLARSLNVHDRGTVAVIASVSTISIIFIASPTGEKILKTKKIDSSIFKNNELKLNLLQYLCILTISMISLILLTESKIPTSFIVILIVSLLLASFNSNLQAFYFHQVGTIGNQYIITSRSILNGLLLVLIFGNYGSNIFNWLICSLLSEFSLFAYLFMKNRNVDWKFESLVSVKKDSKIHLFSNRYVENISVYLSGLHLQLLIVLAASLFSSSDVAFFTIGLSLATLIYMPLTPFLPATLSRANHIFLQVYKVNFRKFILLTIVISFYLVGSSKILQYLIPIFYGEKYLYLVNAMPLIAVSALFLATLDFISTLSRGLLRYKLSIFIVTLQILIFATLILIVHFYSIDNYSLFGVLLIAAMTSTLVGSYFLVTGKKFIS